MSNSISLTVRDFRAIKEAHIDIHHITVLTGYNASGKSTISRLLYYAGYYSNHYDLLLSESLRNSLFNINLFLQRSAAILGAPEISEHGGLTQPFYDHVDRESLLDLVDHLIEYYAGGHKQVRQLEKEYLSRALNKRISARASFITGLDSLKERILKIFQDQDKALEERPLLPFHKEICSLFKVQMDESIWSGISIREQETEVIGGKRKSIGLFTGLDQVFYIDTPMLLSIPGSSHPDLLHWTELNRIFMSPETDTMSMSKPAAELLDEISSIAGGTIHLQHSPTGVFRGRRLEFEGANGSALPISETASGIKSFAILQRLLQKGLLDEGTLMIIDEPEAHLHPQWIVEYARIILKLNRKLGVKFLLASHSPTFVQALHNIADSKGEVDKLTFYLSDRQGDDDTYTFHSVGTDIDPIFGVYNTSYDKIDEYTEEAED